MREHPANTSRRPTLVRVSAVLIQFVPGFQRCGSSVSMRHGHIIRSMTGAIRAAMRSMEAAACIGAQRAHWNHRQVLSEPHSFLLTAKSAGVIDTVERRNEFYEEAGMLERDMATLDSLIRAKLRRGPEAAVSGGRPLASAI